MYFISRMPVKCHFTGTFKAIYRVDQVCSLAGKASIVHEQREALNWHVAFKEPESAVSKRFKLMEVLGLPNEQAMRGSHL